MKKESFLELSVLELQSQRSAEFQSQRSANTNGERGTQQHMMAGTYTGTRATSQEWRESTGEPRLPLFVTVF